MQRANLKQRVKRFQGLQRTSSKSFNFDLKETSVFLDLSEVNKVKQPIKQ